MTESVRTAGDERDESGTTEATQSEVEAAIEAVEENEQILIGS